VHSFVVANGHFLTGGLLETLKKQGNLCPNFMLYAVLEISLIYPTTCSSFFLYLIGQFGQSSLPCSVLLLSDDWKKG
jgi:hypothetical protein